MELKEFVELMVDSSGLKQFSEESANYLVSFSEKDKYKTEVVSVSLMREYDPNEKERAYIASYAHKGNVYRGRGLNPLSAIIDMCAYAEVIFEKEKFEDFRQNPVARMRVHHMAIAAHKDFPNWFNLKKYAKKNKIAAEDALSRIKLFAIFGFITVRKDEKGEEEYKMVFSNDERIKALEVQTEMLKSQIEMNEKEKQELIDAKLKDATDTLHIARE